MAGRVISTRLIVLAVTVPAATSASAPTSTPWALGNVNLDAVTVVIPPGHAGLTGLALEYDGSRIVPWTTGQDWLSGDADSIGVPVDFELGHPLTVVTYNTDATYDHTFHLRAQVSDLQLDQGPGAVAVVPVA